MRSLDQEAEQLARARLAYVSAGQRSLTAPRRALEPFAEPIFAPPPDEPVEAAPPEPVPPDPAPPEPETQQEAGPDPEPIPTTRRTLPPISRTHVLALVVVLVVVVVAVLFALGRGSAEAIPAVPVVQQPAPDGEVPPAQDPAEQGPVEPASESPAALQQVKVHVLGGVRAPGVVTLPEGAIVADAIEAAGGFSDDAVPGDLNLAAPVAGGMQIKVGTPTSESNMESAAPPPGAASAGKAADGRVNLNTATAAELESLPGVGPVTAASIVAWREEHGSFTAVSELQEVSGIGPKTFAKLEPLVSV